jgi:hypothetical protein
MCGLQFSLRSFLAVVTIGSMSIGYWCDRARLQMQAVANLERHSVIVYYDVAPSVSADKDCILNLLDAGQWPSESRILHHLKYRVTAATIGLDFQPCHLKDRCTYFVRPSASHVEAAIPDLKRLHSLRTIYVVEGIGDELCAKLKVSLPDCNLIPAFARVTWYDRDGN